MRKKLIALALCVVMAASLAGCSGELSDEYITIKKYKELEVAQVEKTEVTDESVEQTISGYLQSVPLKKEIKDREIKMGDTINLDYVGSVDGEEFSGGSTDGKGTDIVVGQAGYIGEYGQYKGFEEQLVGHKTGENFDIEVRFPADYFNAELADQVANFNITVNGIYSVETLTKLNDEWVKQNSEKSKTVKEYKKELKKTLTTDAENQYKATLRNEVLQSLMEQVEVKKYPKGAVEEQYKEMEEYYKNTAKQAGMEFGDYLTAYFNMTEEQFETEAKKQCESTVKQKLAIEMLAKKLKLEPTDKEYEKKLKEYADQANVTTERFLEVYSEEVIRLTICQEAVADYLVEECVQVEAADTAE